MNELREKIGRILTELPWLAPALVGAIALLVVWNIVSLERSNEELAGQLKLQKQTLQWMRSASSEAIALKQRMPKAKVVTDAQAMLTILEEEIRKSGLDRNLSRMEPDKGGRARFWFDQVEFVRLMAWLTGLQRQFAIQVYRINLKKGKTPGMVEAQLVMFNRGEGE